MKSRDSKSAPDYPRIPHLSGMGSRMIGDDTETPLPEGVIAFAQEKVDGSNCGMGWEDGPVLRNRTHILRKGFETRTPAKRQFVPAWQWLHEHEDSIRKLSRLYGSQLTVYGEWLWAEHSLHYDLLPDYFLAYDLWSTTAQKFLSPQLAGELFFETDDIHYIPTTRLHLIPSELEAFIELPSSYRLGVREGGVFKIVGSGAVNPSYSFVKNMFKIVRSDFSRQTDDWNDREMVRNEVVSSEQIRQDRLSDFQAKTKGSTL